MLDPKRAERLLWFKRRLGQIMDHPSFIDRSGGSLPRETAVACGYCAGDGKMGKGAARRVKLLQAVLHEGCTASRCTGATWCFPLGYRRRKIYRYRRFV